MLEIWEIVEEVWHWNTVLWLKICPQENWFNFIYFLLCLVLLHNLRELLDDGMTLSSLGALKKNLFLNFFYYFFWSISNSPKHNLHWCVNRLYKNIRMRLCWYYSSDDWFFKTRCPWSTDGSFPIAMLKSVWLIAFICFAWCVWGHCNILIIFVMAIIQSLISLYYMKTWWKGRAREQNVKIKKKILIGWAAFNTVTTYSKGIVHIKNKIVIIYSPSFLSKTV